MSSISTIYEVDHLYQVDPGVLKIGTNVRTDTHPDAKEFATSIKSRGVLEVISAYVDAEGGLTVLRGQRRTLVASKVGTPSGTVPVRVVALSPEADRIIDQASENLHRADLTERETRDAIEQLALLGVSAAAITKQMALPRPAVNSVLAVVANPATKERMDTAGMTLQDAALFAEFEDDPEAIATLTAAWEDRWRRNRLPHVAQQLRDARVEAQALQAEVERLRGEGLPVLDPHEVPSDLMRHALANLRTGDGQPVPQEQWPTIAGAAVAVTVEWVEPEDDDESDADPPEPEQAYVPVWVCTDPQAAGLHYKYGLPTRASAGSDAADDSDEARAARAARPRHAERPTPRSGGASSPTTRGGEARRSCAGSGWGASSPGAPSPPGPRS